MKTVEELVSVMAPEEKIGQLIHLGVREDDHGWPSRDAEKLIREYHVGTVRIYSRKGNPSFYRAYTNQLQEWALSTRLGIPLIIAIDGEPGLTEVVREGVGVFPWPAGLSACGSPETTREVSAAIARESLAIGINFNQRPVLDVNTNPANPIVGLRSPSNDPDIVGEQVEAAIIGAKREGLITGAKHYPGNGDTGFDPHLELGKMDCSMEVLEKYHLAPYYRAIKAGVDVVMTCHVIVPCLDPELPATLSGKILTDLLRRRMGFNGVVMTDSMGMLAIKDHYEAGYSAVQALRAGCDMIAGASMEMLEAMLTAYENDDFIRQRVEESVRRILSLKADRDWFEKSRIRPIESAIRAFGSEEQIDFCESVAARSITVLKNQDALPLEPSERVLVTGACDVHAVADALARRNMRASAYPIRSVTEEHEWAPRDDEIDDILNLSEWSDAVLVLTYTYHGKLPEAQQKLLRRLKQRKAKVIVAALGLPYDASDTAGFAAYLLTYFHAGSSRGPRYLPLAGVFARALADVLTGSRAAAGKCPFDLPA